MAPPPHPPLELANRPAPCCALLLVLLVTFGRSPRASLLVHAHIHSAGQTPAVAHMLQHPGPQVREAVVF